VRRAHRLAHQVGRADEQPAALVRAIVERVRDDRVERGLTDVQSACPGRGRGASTIIAVPIPPPMHSDAAPRPPPRFWSVWTRVVSTRAPLAPIGCPSAI